MRWRTRTCYPLDVLGDVPRLFEAMASPLVDRGFRRGISGFFVGGGAVFWGLKRILGDSKLRGLAVIPLGLTTLVYTVLTGGIIYFTPRLLERFKPDDWMVYLWWLSVVILVLGLLALAAVLFTAIVELVGGPFYDKMAAYMLDEEHIAWKDPGFVKGAVPDLVRGLVLAVPAVVCWGLSLIPVVGIAFWIVGLLIAWFGLGSSALNSALLMTGHSGGQRVKWFLRYLWITLGTGAVISLSMFVPFLGLIAIPSAVVGASRLYAKTEDRTPV
ncbi:MAG: EI24 domain-containing protein [Deltaproteobacteria bacterium]